MDIYNMASFPHPGSPEWMWYQQIRMKIQDESSGPTLADFQAFNLRPRGQAPQRNMRPRFIQTGSRPRVPAPPYHMLNHGQHNMRCSTSPSMVRNSTPQGMVRNNAPQGMVRNNAPQGMLRHNTPQGIVRHNTPQGMMRHSIPQGMMRSNTPQGMARNGIPQSMMNPRLYEPPVHSRPSSNPIEGLQELVNGPQGPSSPINQCISPANQRVSMDSTPRGPSPLSYMETSQTVSHQVPPSGLQVRGHLHSNLQPNTSQHLSNSGMRMPVSINSRPIWFPPPLMKADGTLIRPMEHFSGPWTSQPGNVGYRPGLPYTLTADGNRSYHDQIHTAALHGGQVPNLSVSTNCNETNFHQASSFENTNSINKDSDEETQSSQANGTLSNSIFGRWYKPPSVDEEVKYDYIFDVDSDTQTNRTERSDQENTQTKSSSHLIKRPSKLSHEKKGTKGKRLEGEISRIFSSFQSQLSPLSSDSLPESRTWCETEPDIFSGRSGNNKISSDQSHSQAATSINTLSSTKVGSSITQQFSSSAIESNLSQNVAKEVDRNCSQDSINHPQAAPTITSTNAQAIQQVHCTTNRPMPPLMLAPMTYIKPVGLQSSQQFQPPALTVLSTNHSASLQKQSTVPVVLQSGSVNSSAGNSSSNSADHLGNSQEESNICILDTFSLSRPHVSDIVIQPQELNVNLVSNSLGTKRRKRYCKSRSSENTQEEI
ncbi:uncharacterized protein LOC117335118 [Pecten maximus]|uniref:uncharacterized protein LOC117335118 n=1 Tax=Pecten maximus TaxID=6579 RepID=UPI0014588EB8|nr:uncharacterized protein LOC117335118 [Pecten maximus]XP_033750933.1 uncharacterized protein LOC117335118 [Pecten maximus]